MVRPVELQDNLAKTPAAERVAQTQRTAAENDQRQAMMTVTQKAQTAQRKPTAPPPNDEVIIHRDANPEDQQKRKKDKSHPDASAVGGPADAAPGDEQGEKSSPAAGTVHLDVKI